MVNPSIPRSPVARVGNKLRALSRTWRIKTGIRIAGGNAFEYWGRTSDDTYRTPRAPNAEFLSRGARQLEFLRSLGLRPEHFVLDYGCAILRTAQFLVPFMKPGHYVGADVARLAMHQGVARLAEGGIARSDYHLAVLHDPRLSELDGFAFDYIFSDSVLQYLSDDDFATVIASFRRLVAANGLVYFSFPDEGSKAVLARKGNFYRSPERTRSICEAAGFDVTLHDAGESGYPASPYALIRPRQKP